MKNQVIYINFGWIMGSFLNLFSQVGKPLESVDTKVEHLKRELGMHGKPVYDAKRLLFIQKVIESACTKGAVFLGNEGSDPYEFFCNCVNSQLTINGVDERENELLLIDHYHNISHSKEDIVDINQGIITEENWVGYMLSTRAFTHVRWIKSLNSQFVDPDVSRRLPFDLGLKFNTLINYTEDIDKLVESTKMVYLAFTPDCTPRQYKHLYTILESEGNLLVKMSGLTRPPYPAIEFCEEPNQPLIVGEKEDV